MRAACCTRTPTMVETTEESDAELRPSSATSSTPSHTGHSPRCEAPSSGPDGAGLELIHPATAGALLFWGALGDRSASADLLMIAPELAALDVRLFVRARGPALRIPRVHGLPWEPPAASRTEGHHKLVAHAIDRSCEDGIGRERPRSQGVESHPQEPDGNRRALGKGELVAGKRGA